MKSEFISREKNEVTFTIEYSAEEFEAAIQKAYLAERSKITVDGFRKGKAPRSIIERKYGSSVFFDTALDEMFKDSYPAALDELKLDPVDSPKLEFGDEKLEQGKGFKVTFKVTVAPEVEVKEWKGIEVEFEEAVVTDEDVDNYIKDLQTRNGRLVDSTEAAKLGDTVVLDYKGFVGEEQFAGGTAEGYSLKLGSNTFIPGFEDQLVGVKAGEDKDVVVTFPEQYSAEALAGKEAVFKCTVHEVKAEELPELDDEFAKDVSSFDTFEELKNDTRAMLEKSVAEQNDYAGKNAAMLALCEKNPVEIPDAMINDEVNQMYNEYVQRLSYQGVSPEAVKKYLASSEAKLKENFRPDAQSRVHSSLLIKSLVAKENIEASDEELEEEYKKMAEEYKMEVEKLKESLAGSAEYIKEDIAYRKAVQLVFDNAKIVAPKNAE